MKKHPHPVARLVLPLLVVIGATCAGLTPRQEVLLLRIAWPEIRALVGDDVADVFEPAVMTGTPDISTLDWVGFDALVESDIARREADGTMTAAEAAQWRGRVQQFVALRTLLLEEAQ